MKPVVVTARNCLIAASLVAAAAPGRAGADEDQQSEDPDRVAVSSECMEYWTLSEGADERAAWQAVLSFAACVQDARVAQVHRADQLEALVEHLQRAMEPSLQFYLAVIEDAPDPLKLRAAYAIAMSELSLITRARASIVVPGDRATDPAAAGQFRDLHEQLEPLLQPHATLAYLLFVTIDEAVTNDPTLAPDPVTRYVVRSSREHAAVLRKGWTLPRVDEEPPEVAREIGQGKSR